MDYKIVERGAFDVVGRKKWFLNSDDSFTKLPEFWTECKKSGLYENLVKGLCSGKAGAVTGGESLGICIGKGDGFDYMIGVEKSEDDIPDGLDAVTIPASTWAVFRSVGPMPWAIQSVWKKIYEEWFPSTGYEQTGTTDFEVYMPGSMDDDNYVSEVWIPIKKDKK